MNVRHYITYYDGSPYLPVDQWVVDNAEAVACPVPTIMDRLKALKASIPCEAYISYTDHYFKYADGTQHPQETELRSICTELGIDIESCFLHWAEDTVIDWDYTGSNPDLVTYPAGTRIEKYRQAHQSGNSLRCAVHFGAGVPALNEQVRRGAAILSPAGNAFNGMMIDNAGRSFMNFGVKCISGGICAEYGSNIFTTVPGGGVKAAFTTWRWELQRAAMIQMKAILNAAGQKLTANVSTDWHNDYANYHVADRIHEEAEGSPTRSAVWGYANMRARHVLCATQGVTLDMAPINSTWPTPADLETEAHRALCMHLVIGESTSTFCCQDSTWPWESNWPTNEIPRSENIVKATSGPKLGTLASGDPELWFTGTDTAGNLAHVYVRYYSNGAVFFRMREPYNGALTGSVTFPRPNLSRYVTPDGQVLPAPANITLVNGDGFILIQ